MRLLLFCKYIFLWGFGGITYGLIEVLWRGYTHVSMVILGGVLFVIIGLLNEVIPWNMRFRYQLLIGLSIVVLAEFISGYILNIKLGLNVWDYSDVPFNLMGQICLPYVILWVPLTAFAIWLDDMVRHLIFHERVPEYRW